MSNNILFDASLFLATWTVTIVFAWLLVFQIVVMPGIGKLDDGNFLRAFQVIDGVIQGNQPIFVVVWMGSVAALVSTTVFAFAVDTASSMDKAGLVLATLAYLVCQYTTFTINVPLNNRLQTFVDDEDIEKMDDFSKRTERDRFEDPWNRWNLFRTVIMGGVSFYLLWLEGVGTSV